MNEIVFLVSEPPEEGYAAEALGHSIFTGGDNLEELNEMVRDAVLCHFDDEERPKIIRLHLCVKKSSWYEADARFVGRRPAMRQESITRPCHVSGRCR
jgi:hypothetical protein